MASKILKTIITYRLLNYLDDDNIIPATLALLLTNLFDYHSTYAVYENWDNHIPSKAKNLYFQRAFSKVQERLKDFSEWLRRLSDGTGSDQVKEKGNELC